MCGVAGYFNISHAHFSINTDILNTMQKALAHRGPDGYKIWSSPNNQLGLIHRRLSIVDLSDAGFQPLFDKQQTVAVSCNGEIYNYKELRQKLETLGHEFISHSDSEVIVHAYKQWGIAGIEQLQGMFAIILYDIAKDELYLVRDRIGIKQLYFSLQAGICSFASEIKALWVLPWIIKELNLQGLYHYLTYLATPAPMTLYKDIYKLPPSFYVKIDANRNITFHEWYSPITSITRSLSKQLNNEAYCLKNIKKLLLQSVEKHMMSDVPVGVFLSGGVDSSLNVALMAEFTDNIRTFNVSWADEPDLSESNWARKVARKFNTDHHEIIIGEKEAFDFFENMVYLQDEPLADCVSIPLYYVAKLLKDAGVTVVHVGEGSDELFCGYSTYVQYINFYHRFWKYSQMFIPAFAKQGTYNFFTTLFPSRYNRIDVVKNWAEGRALFWSGALAFSECWKKKILKDLQACKPDPIVEQIHPGLSQQFDSFTVVDYHLQQLYKRMPDVDFFTSMTYLELKHRLPELLLMRVDKMTMANSVEARVPFLDTELVEFALAMPMQMKYRNKETKYILKKVAEQYLPLDVIYRKKQGFAAPTMRWFKEGDYFKTYFSDMLQTKRNAWGQLLDITNIEKLFTQHQQPNRDHSLQLWVIQNLLASDIAP